MSYTKNMLDYLTTLMHATTLVADEKLCTIHKILRSFSSTGLFFTDGIGPSSPMFLQPVMTYLVGIRSCFANVLTVFHNNYMDVPGFSDLLTISRVQFCFILCSYGCAKT